MTVIAHIGGAAGLLYLAPVVIVVAVIVVQNIRDRRRGDTADSADTTNTDDGSHDPPVHRSGRAGAVEDDPAE